MDAAIAGGGGLGDVDLILCMSVNPGFGGQAFITNTLDKIRQLKQMIAQRGISPLVQIDGGVNNNTIAEVARAGAAGSTRLTSKGSLESPSASLARMT